MDTVARAVELIDQECIVDFIDINMGCPIDIVVNKGAGSALLTKPMRIKGIVGAASGTTDKPLTVKVQLSCQISCKYIIFICFPFSQYQLKNVVCCFDMKLCL